jgi:hypothetical protein
MMIELFINEFVGAIVQLIMFSFIPLIFWLISSGKKQNFFQWIGIKKSVAKENGGSRHARFLLPRECT